MSGRPRRRGWAALALTVAAACAAEPTIDLAEASEAVQFESVAELGSHRMAATIRRQEHRGDTLVADVQEALEVRWQGWEAFEMRRLVDGEQTSLVRVVDGLAWAQRRDGSWVQRGDPEPWRQEMRLTWNAWDEVLEPFDDRVKMQDPTDEVVEGRRARRYALSLAEAEPERTPPQAGKRKGKRKKRKHGRAGPEPLTLSGDVVLDEATATRLLAQVAGSWRDEDRRYSFTLDLSRSGIGLPQTLERPAPGTGAVRGAAPPPQEATTP